MENINTVWLDERNLLAAFHPVKRYTPRSYPDRSHFMVFLQKLVEKGYRFM